MIFPIDDAYIALHSARYLFSTDPNYDGPGLTGATSLVHVLLLRLALTVLPPIWALTVVTAAGAACYVWGAQRLIWSATTDRVQRGVCLVLAVTVGAVPFHLVSGLETGWAMAAVAWTFYGLKTGARWLPWLVGALPWIRPELGALTVIVLVGSLTGLDTGYRVPYRRRSVRGLQEQSAGAPPRVSFHAAASIRILAPTVLLGVLGCLVYWSLAGTFYPSTFAAKRLVFGVWTMIPHNYYRYLYPIGLPLLLMGFARAPQPLALLALTWALWTAPVNVVRISVNRAVVSAQQEIADWLNAHDPQAVVLLHDAGYLSEATRNPLVDWIGLKTPEAIALHQRFPVAEAISRLACQTQPRYLVLFRTIDQQFGVRAGLEQAGWTLTPILTPQTAFEPYRYTLFRLHSPT